MGLVNLVIIVFIFFFNDTATTEIYTLSLHDALPISWRHDRHRGRAGRRRGCRAWRDRKSTRLNSSHLGISYAVFCLKKKKKEDNVLLIKKKKKKKKPKKKKQKKL